MTPGITLVVVGAILAFAVRADPSGIDLQTVGWILLVTGVCLIVYEVLSNRQGQDDKPGQDPTGTSAPGSRGRTVDDTNPGKDRR